MYNFKSLFLLNFTTSFTWRCSAAVKSHCDTSSALLAGSDAKLEHGSVSIHVFCRVHIFPGVDDSAVHSSLHKRSEGMAGAQLPVEFYLEETQVTPGLE